MLRQDHSVRDVPIETGGDFLRNNFGIYSLLLRFILFGLLNLVLVAPVLANSGEYYHIVLLSDPHLPVREHKVKDTMKQQNIIAAKNNVVEVVNTWNDVSEIVVLGDVVARVGNEQEYLYAAEYFAKFNKPVSFINGNHDYLYENFFSSKGKNIRGDAASRLTKLSRFKDTFGLQETFYSRIIGNYCLLFLSIDSLNSTYSTQISDYQLTWLQKELRLNSGKPTIIFFHAPLSGTLSRIKSPNSIAQPDQAIQEIINANPQIFLWVSGHTHTPPTNPDFASPINLFQGQVTNIHNTDMDREAIWTNSLFIYPDKVVVKTFDHREGKWLELERRIVPPILM